MMRTAMLLIAALLPCRAAAQGAWEATYTVHQGGREVARERIVLRAGQAGDNSRLELESRRSGSSESARAVLSRMQGGVFDALHLELRDGQSPETIRVTNQGSRIFITTTSGGARGGRELPGGPGVIMLDDRMPGLLVTIPDMVTGNEARLIAISPRTGQRTPFTATRTSGGVKLSGGITGQVTLDAAGLVERVTLGDGTVLARLGG